MKYLLLLLGFFYFQNKDVVISHKYYNSYYNVQYKVPDYTFYYFTAKNRTHTYDRTTFHQDSLISDDLQSNGSDYIHTSYDKGHLAPDDDFRFDSIGERETMVYTNAAPQYYKFNRQTWKHVEDHVRYIGAIYDTVKVWTGCIYETKKTLGKGITIPDYYWKVLYFNNIYQCFIFRNDSTSSNISINIKNKDTDTTNFYIIKQKTKINF